MTEKRFTLYESDIYNRNDVIHDKGIEMPQSTVCDLLNELHEERNYFERKKCEYWNEFNIAHLDNINLRKENEQLKKENNNLRDFRGFITKKNVFNEKERKELQLQLLRLYNYFENYFEDTMSPNAFSEMWDNVKEDERWEND